jgi:hypothetical protein
VIRPHWGHRLVMDAEQGKLIDVGELAGSLGGAELDNAAGERAALMRRVVSAERAESVQEIERAALLDVSALRSQSQRRDWNRVVSSAQLAGQMGLRQAIVPLRLLEEKLIGAARGTEGELEFSELRFFQHVRMALRRLGEVPGVGYGVWLRTKRSHGVFTTDDSSGKPLQSLVPVEARRGNAGKVIAGMSLREMTELIGFPDSSCGEGAWNCYDYDIDGDDAFTLRVCFDEKKNEVKSVEQIRPAVWKDLKARGSSW